ncbi:MAG: TonB-dependent receptor, partial [Bacteroidota bacterium]|nr:TonB-dependent receptor [Bacteroidota bacterium]
MKKILILVVAILAAAQYNYAQSPKRDTLSFKYPVDVTITGARIIMPLKDVPFSASIVGSDFIERLPRSIGMEEPMKLVPGVKVDNQANGARVHLSIRGQGILSERGIRGIKILQDGIPINDPSGFAPDFFDVDFANVKNIEVLRGAAASLYGGSAAGGVINITTKNGENKPFGGEVFGMAGSNSFWKSGLQLGGASSDLNYRLSASRSMGDGYRTHTHFQGDNVYGKVTYTPTDNISITPVISWSKWYHENPEGINLDYFNRDPKLPNDDAVPFNEYLETNRFTGGVSGSINIMENNSILFNGYVKSTKFTEANNKTFTHRQITNPGGTLQYVLNTAGKNSSFKNTVSAGIDFQGQNIDEYGQANDHSFEVPGRLFDQKYKQAGLGLFVIDKVNLNEQWGAMVSLRYDNLTNKLTDNLNLGQGLSGDKDFSKTTGRIGVTYSPLTEMNLYANWGQGFLPPATEELAHNPFSFGGFNNDLTFATSNCIDLGVRGLLRDNLRYDLAGFYMTTKNDFDRYRVSGRGQEVFYRNFGSSKRLGVELYVAYSPIKEIELQAAYTYSNFKYNNDSPIRILMDDTSIVKYIKKDNFLPNSPEHQLYLDLQYFVLPELTVSLNAEMYSKSYIDGANVESEAAEGYTLLGASISYTIKISNYSIGLNVAGRNLADKKYAAFTEPDPG